MTDYSDEALTAAHRHSSDHRGEIERSEMCGCFYCRRVFAPSEIAEWVNDGTTALCPHCGIDAVIGSASGCPVSKPEFLRAMKRRWF